MVTSEPCAGWVCRAASSAAARARSAPDPCVGSGGCSPGVSGGATSILPTSLPNRMNCGPLNELPAGSSGLPEMAYTSTSATSAGLLRSALLEGTVKRARTSSPVLATVRSSTRAGATRNGARGGPFLPQAARARSTTTIVRCATGDRRDFHHGPPDISRQSLAATAQSVNVWRSRQPVREDSREDISRQWRRVSPVVVHSVRGKTVAAIRRDRATCPLVRTGLAENLMKHLIGALAVTAMVAAPLPASGQHAVPRGGSDGGGSSSSGGSSSGSSGGSTAPGGKISFRRGLAPVW